MCLLGRLNEAQSHYYKLLEIAVSTNDDQLKMRSLNNPEFNAAKFSLVAVRIHWKPENKQAHVLVNVKNLGGGFPAQTSEKSRVIS